MRFSLSCPPLGKKCHMIKILEISFKCKGYYMNFYTQTRSGYSGLISVRPSSQRFPLVLAHQPKIASYAPDNDGARLTWQNAILLIHLEAEASLNIFYETVINLGE